MQHSFDPETRVLTLSFVVQDEGKLSASGKSIMVAGTNAGRGGTEHVSLADGRYMLNVSVFKKVKTEKAKQVSEAKQVEKVNEAKQVEKFEKVVGA